MRSKEQQVNDSQALKKALIGNAIMLAVIAIGIVLAVFAWFLSVRANVDVRGINIQSLEDLHITYHTYAGTEQQDGSISYDMTLDMNTVGFGTVNDTLMPGEKRYFKTIVSNFETNSYQGDMVLLNTLVNRKVSDLSRTMSVISFGANIENETPPPPYNMTHGNAYYVDGVRSSVYDVVTGIYIYPDLILPAATGVQQPSEVTIYWYFELNGKAFANYGEESSQSSLNLMGEPLMEFSGMKFMMSKTIN